MSREYLTLGSAPVDEECAQVGSDDYMRRANVELLAYMDQLSRLFPDHKNVEIGTKSFPHDFGTYREVVVWFDTNDKEACKQAFHIEDNTPDHWDARAMELLSQGGFPAKE